MVIGRAQPDFTPGRFLALAMETELERWLSADGDEGDDACKPQVLFVFGLDTASGRPDPIVSLVSLPVWGRRWMSTDTSEGDPSVDLTVTPG